MALANHHDVVQTFPSNRANHPLGIRVLPRCARRDDRFLDVQHRRLVRKSLSIDTIAVPDQIPSGLLLSARLEQLSRRPFRCRMLRDIEMHEAGAGCGSALRARTGLESSPWVP